MTERKHIVYGQAHEALTDALADLLHVFGGDEERLSIEIQDRLPAARSHFQHERADPDLDIIVDRWLA